MTEEENKNVEQFMFFGNKDTKRDINMGVEAYYQVQELTKKLDSLSDKVYGWSKTINERIYVIENKTRISHDKVNEVFVIEDIKQLGLDIESYLEENSWKGYIEIAADIVRMVKGENV